MSLTNEERTIVEGGGNVAIVLDGIPCVVMREDIFATVRNVLGDELDYGDLRGMLTRAFETSGWNDPAMDIYDDYDKHV